MLVNTNDGFTGLDAVSLPRAAGKGPAGGSSVFMVMGYDAGSEMNDQLLANIPGPCCGDMDRNGTAEMRPISHHPGILAGVGQLDPATWGWPVDQPVARITIENITPTPTETTIWGGIKSAQR